MPVLASSSMLSPWLVLPIAVVTMVLIAGHVLMVQRAAMPDVRRRIRTAAGLLMLFVSALMSYALGIMPSDVHADAGRARVFLVVWMLIAALVFFILMLAIADMFYTLHLGAAMRRELRRQAMADIAGATHAARDQRRA